MIGLLKISSTRTFAGNLPNEEGFLTLARGRPSQIPFRTASPDKRSERAAIATNTTARNKRRKKGLDLLVNVPIIESPPLQKVACVVVEQEDESLSKSVSIPINEEVLSSEPQNTSDDPMEDVIESLNSTDTIPCEGEKERVQSLVVEISMRLKEESTDEDSLNRLMSLLDTLQRAARLSQKQEMILQALRSQLLLRLTKDRIRELQLQLDA